MVFFMWFETINITISTTFLSLEDYISTFQGSIQWYQLFEELLWIMPDFLKCIVFDNLTKTQITLLDYQWVCDDVCDKHAFSSNLRTSLVSREMLYLLLCISLIYKGDHLCIFRSKEHNLPPLSKKCNTLMALQMFLYMKFECVYAKTF